VEGILGRECYGFGISIKIRLAALLTVFSEVFGFRIFLVNVLRAWGCVVAMRTPGLMVYLFC
jgi:hypothetical protein